MSLQIFADGALAYDSRLEDYALLGLKTTGGLNKGGTMTITMPPGHPAYNSFISYKTLVTLYEDGVLKFRGRALYPDDDFYNCRTITCEGERCFFRDADLSPHSWLTIGISPAQFFAELIELYNARVDEFKRFTVGAVTVDSVVNILTEVEVPTKFADFIDKVVGRYGGYITFTDAEDGSRAVNWLKEVGTVSGQPIEFGENLLEFARSGQTEDFATIVRPIGGEREDGTVVTLEGHTELRNVTVDGCIENPEAIALRGRITALLQVDTLEYLDLFHQGNRWLDEHSQVVTSLQLTAADLSRMDKSIDSYDVGDWVPVNSEPHGVDGLFQLVERETDWLNPDGGSITLGKVVSSLTGADVSAAAGAVKKATEAKAAASTAKTGAAAALAETEQRLSSSIDQLADSITLEVSGSLGGIAAIKLTVDGTGYEHALYLDKVRQAFADDTTAVDISAGLITFNAGTIVINSDKFKVDKYGAIEATDATIYGDIITVDGSYKTELDRGSLRLYYNDTLCGTVNTKYWSGASSEGISLRVEEGGQYLMFSHADDTQGSGYTVDYYLNAGWSDYEEKHIFQTSARFLDGVYVSGPARIRSLRLFGAGGEYLVGINSSGALTVSKL